MGRLVKAFSLDRESARLGNFDEKQFLQEAGEIAARLRSEIGTSSNEILEPAPRARREARSNERYDEPHTAAHSLRFVNDDHDSEALNTVDLALQVGDLDEAREAMSRLRRDRDTDQRTTEVAKHQADRQVAADRHHAADRQLVDEQLRWEEQIGRAHV